jgi:hypothetical protein
LFPKIFEAITPAIKCGKADTIENPPITVCWANKLIARIKTNIEFLRILTKSGRSNESRSSTDSDHSGGFGAGTPMKVKLLRPVISMSVFFKFGTNPLPTTKRANPLKYVT